MSMHFRVFCLLVTLNMYVQPQNHLLLELDVIFQTYDEDMQLVFHLLQDPFRDRTRVPQVFSSMGAWPGRSRRWLLDCVAPPNVCNYLAVPYEPAKVSTPEAARNARGCKRRHSLLSPGSWDAGGGWRTRLP